MVNITLKSLHKTAAFQAELALARKVAADIEGDVEGLESPIEKPVEKQSRIVAVSASTIQRNVEKPVQQAKHSVLAQTGHIKVAQSAQTNHASAKQALSTKLATLKLAK